MEIKNFISICNSNTRKACIFIIDYIYREREREINEKLLLNSRRRKAREEISAAGVIEVWGLSPREAPPEYVLYIQLLNG